MVFEGARHFSNDYASEVFPVKPFRLTRSIFRAAT